jgi:RNA polymerase sigma-70 factor (ECF subfamily)
MGNEGTHLSDKALVSEILNGNVQGFALVVKNTERLVTQIVRKMIANEDDQKDLVQDIYLKAYQYLPSFQFKSKLSTWVAHIAYNTTLNYLQKKKIAILEIEPTALSNFGGSENPEIRTIEAESVDILHAEIARLPPLYQTLITLYHLEELPNKEISEITNLPEGTIKSYLYRARKMLKDGINQQYRKH